MFSDIYFDMTDLILFLWLATFPYLAFSYFVGTRAVKAIAECGDEWFVQKSRMCLKLIRIWPIAFVVIVLVNPKLHMFYIMTRVPDIFFLLPSAVVCQTPIAVVNAYFAVQLFMWEKTSLALKNALAFLVTAFPSILAVYRFFT